MENIAAFLDCIANRLPVCLWQYEGQMKVVNFPESGFNQVGASGDCPHCSTVNSYFRPLVSSDNGYRMVSAARCETCKEFVLIVGEKKHVGMGQGQPCESVEVYPLGKPKQLANKDIPIAVANDFNEALRCQFIEAFKATVVMCGRAIQTSALALGAQGNRLVDQIDDLFKKGKITEALKDFAHEVRLVRNDGAHPDKDGLADVTDQDAAAIIEFTREYLHHVYVMPAKLEARRGKTVGTTTP